MLGGSVLGCTCEPIHCHCTQCRELGGMVYVYVSQGPCECILIFCSWVIGYLKACFALCRILIDIQVGALFKAVTLRFRRGRLEIVMNIGQSMRLLKISRHSSNV